MNKNSDGNAFRGGGAYLNSSAESWPGGVCGHCGARQQAAGIGLEPTLGEWVANIVAVGREVWRVLRDDGSLWLNLGDAYAGSWGNYSPTGQGGQRGKNTERWERPAYADNTRLPPAANMPGLPAKNLMGQPWRAAFALQDDGWILRSAIVWHKPNPMPESVRDRPTNAYEMVFLLAKQGRYFYDAEAVRVPYAESVVNDKRDNGNGHRRERGFPGDPSVGGTNLGGNRNGGANARNVWTIPTQGRSDAHFATFPDELPRRCILAGTSERGVCADCGAPWVRQISKNEAPHDGTSATAYPDGMNASNLAKLRQASRARGGEYAQQAQTLGWQPTCGCNADTVPATVLDPFAGCGTTVAVAQELGRRGIGVDLNLEYLAIARKRLEGITLPMALTAS